MPTKRTAIHEAGHIIAALTLDATVHGASIERDGRGGADVETKAGDTETDALISAAGMAAERLLLGTNRRPPGDSANLWSHAKAAVPDRLNVSRHTTAVKRSAWVEGQVQKALALLRPRMKCVQKVAGALQSRGSLTGREIQRILSGHPTHKGNVSMKLSELRALQKRYKGAYKSGRVPTTPKEWMEQQLAIRAEYEKDLKQRCERGNKAACAVN